MKSVTQEFQFRTRTREDPAQYCYMSAPFYDNQNTIYPFIELLTQKSSKTAKDLMKREEPSNC